MPFSAASNAHTIWRWTLRFWRNMRVSPVATYLAYKCTGYADQGTFAGMTVSDFVAVWAPYNNNEAPRDILGREKKGMRRKHTCLDPKCSRWHI